MRLSIVEHRHPVGKGHLKIAQKVLIMLPVEPMDRRAGTAVRGRRRLFLVSNLCELRNDQPADESDLLAPTHPPTQHLECSEDDGRDHGADRADNGPGGKVGQRQRIDAPDQRLDSWLVRHWPVLPGPGQPGRGKTARIGPPGPFQLHLRQ